jgi:hypothetical protein
MTSASRFGDSYAVETGSILEALSGTQGLPRDALQLASERRGDLAPSFIAEVERYLAAGLAERAGATPLFFIFHLLGEWREKSAYRPLARLLRSPPEELDDILGDGVTETVHRVMAAVFDGDPEPLFAIVLDPAANEHVRARICEALAMLVRRGELDRGVAERFFREAFDKLRPVEDCWVWHGWQESIAVLGLADLRPLVKEAFERGWIDPFWLKFEDFEDDLARGVAGLPIRSWHDSDEHELWGDSLAEFSTWAGFRAEAQRDREKSGRTAGDLAVWPPFDAGRAANPFRHVGRNDPCPCGSGKKYKKCCLN